jgi:predicted aspartyl protease
MFKTARSLAPLLLLIVLVAPRLPALDTTHSAPLELSHGKPFVMVTINGKGPFRFVIDTGTGGEAFVTPELADQLNLPSAGQGRLSDPSGQGSRRVQIVLLQSLEVAGVEFTGVKASRHTLSEVDGTCQGLLGFALFRDYLLTLDYPHRRITLTSGALEPDGEHSVLPFRMPDGIPIVPLRVGGLQIEAQIDSGGSGLSLPESFVSRLKFSSVPAAFGNAHSLSTRFLIKAGTLASDISLGGYTFTRPFVEINPAFPLANFGSCPMQSFAFTFDQKNSLVRFEARQPVLHLSATPTPVRRENAPANEPLDPTLVPVG